MDHANETCTRTGCPFSFIALDVSNSLKPRVSVKESKKDSRAATRAASNRARTRVMAREYSLDNNPIRVTRPGILKLWIF
ncbi:hypothetical protein CRG98_042626 [Punica granatum]|uniref:Uncharacterized protein n=1 Tax=Punica granatum TaxID=22663 RepID=A0A2I0HZG3_PUNGR|nr:hypothetical protein CRG98_042626 [Punica granatum]